MVDGDFVSIEVDLVLFFLSIEVGVVLFSATVFVLFGWLEKRMTLMLIYCKRKTLLND
jgi:hypothetical protein